MILEGAFACPKSGAAPRWCLRALVVAPATAVEA
jgi:hypothetical protein